MTLATIDIAIIIFFFTLTLAIGVYVARTSGKSTDEFFLSGRSMPWWLLGMSMVATTFSTDTPNLVTDIVRQNGVSGNWVWWIFLITGMLTVFVYAKLWRKSNVTTDIEFYELRYGGAAAKFLRGFRSVFLGLVFNVLAMSAVTLAAIKIGAVMLDLSPIQTVGLAALVTVIFSSLGGFKGVVYTDFILFFVAMIGSIGAAVVAVNHPDVGGLSGLINHAAVTEHISILPRFDNKDILISLVIIPLAVQWWAAWYPGAEPGGGGYIAQRMLASKNENHAVGATFFFNILHYALRPWPWILVALASLVVFPDLDSLRTAFPNVDESKIGHDLAYPAMLTFLPAGLLGLVLAALIAAFMSTISTHLNWGASYLVNDFYRRFLHPDASEKECVTAGRVTTFLLMALAAVTALAMRNALQIFDFIIMFGAGTGLIFLLRWFWWRINAWSEIAAMFSSGIISFIFVFGNAFPASWAPYWRFPLIVMITTIIWLSVTFLTQPESSETLRNFYRRIQPGGRGWKKVIDGARMDGVDIVDAKAKWTLPSGILAMLAGTVLIYSLLFATGKFLFGQTSIAAILFVVAIISAWILVRFWNKVGKEII
ncbi:MAG: Na+:solute symporter [Saprospiraceae bacterium]|nr:Na+:solute symporter [Saprospiraceae bacterium]